MIDHLIQLQKNIDNLEEQIDRLTEIRDPLFDELVNEGIEISRQVSTTPKLNGYYYYVGDDRHGIFYSLLECLLNIKEDQYV